MLAPSGLVLSVRCFTETAITINASTMNAIPKAMDPCFSFLGAISAFVSSWNLHAKTKHVSTVSVVSRAVARTDELFIVAERKKDAPAKITDTNNLVIVTASAIFLHFCLSRTCNIVCGLVSSLCSSTKETHGDFSQTLSFCPGLNSALRRIPNCGEDKGERLWALELATCVDDFSWAMILWGSLEKSCSLISTHLKQGWLVWITSSNER